MQFLLHIIIIETTESANLRQGMQPQPKVIWDSNLHCPKKVPTPPPDMSKFPQKYRTLLSFNRINKHLISIK